MIEDLLLLNLSAYFPGVDFPIGLFLPALAIALAIFSVVYSLIAKAVATLIKQLLRAKAIGEENAKTLSELRLDGEKLLSSILRKGKSRISHLVRRAGVKDGEMQTMISKEELSKAQFFIPEEKKAEAEYLYENKNPSLGGVIVFCAAVLAVAGVLWFFLPDLLAFLARILSSAE